ncbi:MAG TPA: response regulator transcription factor [Verrucomicrobiae bacterium]|jgi:DNA-binding NarL/FixJ family response regulator|nr:response regulator transcription factor [Verrucomicrobiae bacterium]
MKRNTTIIPTKPPPRPPLRVALVEDEAKIRESWSRLIDSFPDFKCVCCCESGEEALRVVPGIQPDVILMDVLLPGISGIECTMRLKELLPQTQTIILTALDDDKLIFRALEAGADGYLLKRTKPADMRAALLDVLHGGAPMTSAIARRVVESFRRSSPGRSGAILLSPREEELLDFLSKGYSNKEIADQTQLSFETVRSYLKHIYEKMHVRSRTEAAVRYVNSKSL